MPAIVPSSTRRGLRLARRVCLGRRVYVVRRVCRVRRVRGIAALALTMLLLFALLLGVAFVNRNLVFEQRASANQYRSTQAFEAAEAGLEWTLARLNDPGRIDADCLPSIDADASSFRDRHLIWNVRTATYSATTWLDAGSSRPLQPACVRGSAGWDCACPAAGLPVLALPAGARSAPAFSVQILPTPQPGQLRLLATGCSALAGPCRPGDSTAPDAIAQVQVLVALLPAVRTLPAAALTVRGSVDADGAAFGAHNRDPASGGVAIHAGNAVAAAAAYLTQPPGAAPAAAVVHHDATLAALEPARLFATYFGLDREHWGKQPGVQRITCTDDCAVALAGAIGTGATRVHVTSDLRLEGPLALGAPLRPVVIAVDGLARFNGAVRLDGLLYAAALRWDGGSGLVRGAVVAEGDYGGSGTPEIVYDTDVLARLKGGTGSFARVSGSWRDF